MKVKIIIFGTGKGSIDFISKCNMDKVEVLAFCDNDDKKWDKVFCDRKVINPYHIKYYDFKYIVIASSFYKEITLQLLGMGIEKDDIRYVCKKLEYKEFMEGHYAELYSETSCREILNNIMERDLKKEIYRISSKEEICTRLYKKYSGKEINFNDPRTLNEKMQYLMAFVNGEREALCTDKYAVKSYIESKQIKGLSIAKLYGVYDSVEQIDFDELPECFVFKATHSCDCNIPCENKQELNIYEAKKQMSDWLKEDYSTYAGEFHYGLVKPRIICEEYLKDENVQDLIDYKFHCFCGKADSVLLCTERSTGLKLNYLDMDYKPLYYEVESIRGTNIPLKPKCFDKMKEIAEELSKPFPFVRVDLYLINGDIYFGELTFTPQAGRIAYLTEEAQEKMGQLLDINYKG